MKTFEYKPGVRYRVFEDARCVLETQSAGREPITTAVQNSARKLLGTVKMVALWGDDGTYIVLTAQNKSRK